MIIILIQMYKYNYKKSLNLCVLSINSSITYMCSSSLGTKEIEFWIPQTSRDRILKCPLQRGVL